jgi:hypothetical protein
MGVDFRAETTMKISPLAGHPPPPEILLDVSKLITAYYTVVPDPAVAAERAAFGTSGHRGSSFDRTFNEAHIVAITEAIWHYRRKEVIDGPLFLGIDTHALSQPRAPLRSRCWRRTASSRRVWGCCRPITISRWQCNTSSSIVRAGRLAARPSGIEDVYRIYAESFRGKDALDRIVEQAHTIVDAALAAGAKQ